MGTDPHRREELASFLRSRRERIRPEQVGFPAGPRRRTGGLRREEVAVLAGVSPTWYTYLEQGRDIRPSPELLDSLARVLDLSEDERRYLHTLVYGHVIRPQPLRTGTPSEDVVRQLVTTAGLDGYPMYATNHRSDLIGWNTAAAEWYDDWNRLPPEDRNMMRWMLTAPEARERLLDWEDECRNAVARWRVQTVKWAGDRRLRERIDEFHRISPEFSRWWSDHDVVEHRTRIRRFKHVRLGVQAVRLVVMQAPEFATSYVAFHLPVEAEAERDR